MHTTNTSFLLVSYLICVSLTRIGVGFSPFGSTCSSYGSCASCASTQSLVPFQNCRWCPQSRTCHATGSWSNPCGFNDQITDSNKCTESDAKHTKYDPNAAKLMIAYSESARLSDPHNGEFFPPTSKLVKTFEYVSESVGGSVFGYIAIDETYNRIIVAFRGTKNMKQLIREMVNNDNAMIFPSKQNSNNLMKVNKFFMSSSLRLFESYFDVTKSTIIGHPQFDVWITGHSLGGALATLCAVLLKEQTELSHITPLVYTLGQPRVGNKEFAEYFDSMIPNAFRIVDDRDIVPHLPPLQSEVESVVESLVDVVTMNGGSALEYEPFHSSTEIWYYGGGYVDGVMCQYSECVFSGATVENQSCSNGYSRFSALDHFGYWDVLTKNGGEFCVHSEI